MPEPDLTMPEMSFLNIGKFSGRQFTWLKIRYKFTENCKLVVYQLIEPTTNLF